MASTVITSRGSTTAGSCVRNSSSGRKKGVPSSASSPARSVSKLVAIPRPSAKPISVPPQPTVAPHSRKIRRIAPLPAPMVRRMAMSRPLSFTSMVSEEMMLKAATTTISVRIRNITFRSTTTAA